ncbi:MAG: citryl-CoA lyase [Candidatus Wildermuthbacteria bacterium]|nr:citryl-CoA lyase [Candidatus Wildermuthbacteria bacterium]
MKFKTKISQTKDGKHLIRGHDLIECIKNKSFADTVFLLLRGDLPKENEKKLLEAMLIASVENGIEAPSLYVPRVVAASGNDFHTALAAGMLSIGEKHGGAAEKAAALFSSGESAKEIIKSERIIPGFGHKTYKDEDPRAKALCEKARELEFSCMYFNAAYEIEKELAQKKGRKLPLNIDGAIACCMLELGFDARLGKAFFLLSRIVGMSAHIIEEMKQENSYYRLEEGDVEYEE